MWAYLANLLLRLIRIKSFIPNLTPWRFVWIGIFWCQSRYAKLAVYDFWSLKSEPKPNTSHATSPQLGLRLVSANTCYNHLTLVDLESSIYNSFLRRWSRLGFYASEWHTKYLACCGYASIAFENSMNMVNHELPNMHAPPLFYCHPTTSAIVCRKEISFLRDQLTHVLGI